MQSTVNTTVFCKIEPIQIEACVKDIKEEKTNSELEKGNLHIHLNNQNYVQSSCNNFQIKDQFGSTEDVKWDGQLEIKEEPLEYTFCEDEYLNNQSDQGQGVANNILIKCEKNENSDYKIEDRSNEGAEKKYLDNDLNIVSNVSIHNTMTCKLEIPHESAIKEEKIVSDSKEGLLNVGELKSGKPIHMNDLDVGDICDERFKSERVISNIHFRTHTGKKRYKCDFCEKCFSYRSSFSYHMRTHTGEKPFKCDICAKCFSDRGSLTRHIRTHTGERPFKCDICGKCFNDCFKLNRHTSTHTGEKRHQCDICAKCFSDRGSLTRHMRTHTGEKPFKCDICGKCFRICDQLNRHMRTHTGERRFKCDICAKCFKHSGNLICHLRTHTGERPFKCDICGKGFNDRFKLNRHMSTHAGEKAYKCDICGNCFSRGNNLNAHIRKHK